MMYLNKLFLINIGVFFLIVIAQASAVMHCEVVGVSAIPSAYGKLTKTKCSNFDKNGPRNQVINDRETLNIDGVPVLAADHLYDIENNKDGSLWLFSTDEMDNETYCNSRMYLVDITKRPVKVLGFGVKKACTEFGSVKWGDKKTVITLKQKVKFIYQNGQMKLPVAGDKLFDDVEPPHGGVGMTQGDPQPFCEEMPLPESNAQTEK